MRTVADEMLSPPVLVSLDTTIQQASARMLDAGAHAVLVVEDGRLRGLVTADDVADALARGHDTTITPISAIAHVSPPVARVDERLADVHLRMRAARRAVLPVVDARERPVGILHDPEAAG